MKEFSRLPFMPKKFANLGCEGCGSRSISITHESLMRYLRLKDCFSHYRVLFFSRVLNDRFGSYTHRHIGKRAI